MHKPNLHLIYLLTEDHLAILVGSIQNHSLLQPKIQPLPQLLRLCIAEIDALELVSQTLKRIQLDALLLIGTEVHQHQTLGRMKLLQLFSQVNYLNQLPPPSQKC